MHITGTIVYQDLEGGFRGIQGDDGVPYRPVDGLPRDFQRVGMKISAHVRPVSVVSIHMWGRNVALQSIQSLTSTDQ